MRPHWTSLALAIVPVGTACGSGVFSTPSDGRPPDAGAAEAALSADDAGLDSPEAVPAEAAPERGAATSALDTLITEKMGVARVPGLVAVAIKGNRIVFEQGYGLATIEQALPVTPDTLFDLASVSKTVAAVALLQLRDQGWFALDDDVDTNLPFKARSPSFPTVPITYRMLLAHTSGILDSAQAWAHIVYGQDSPIPLEAFMSGYLRPDGAYYLPGNWSDSRPGTAFVYSNSGTSLEGDLAERIAGADLQTYSQQHIFAPLGMGESSWFLADLDRADIAMPYRVDASGDYVPVGYYGYPEYPSGQLRTSGHQLAQFLMMLAQGGTLGGATLLASSTVTEMMTTQPNSVEGLGLEFLKWPGTPDAEGPRLDGHVGVDTGVSTDMWFDPATGAGFVVLTNSDVYDSHFDQLSSGNYGPEVQAMVDLENALLALAEDH
jgi:CubicO group peptidase (beta-lactamase class C family)